MRTFIEVWYDLKKLKGKPVFTLVNHRRNYIIDVNPAGIRRRSDSGKETNIPYSDFKGIWEKLLKIGHYMIEDGPFICACLANLSEVEYSLKPGTIWLSENRHEFGKLVGKIK